jgi:hypothetical protein
MDVFDEADQLDDDLPMSGQVKNQQYTMINNWKIPDLSMRFFDSGSIQDETQANVWTNIKTLGDLQGVTDLSFAAITPQPQIYLIQSDSVVSTHWISGHLNILIKVKTNTLADLNKAQGQIIDNGQLTAYVRNFTHFYSNTASTKIGGTITLPLSTASDINNTTGTHSLSYDNEASGPFIVGEQIATSDFSATGIVLNVTDAGATGTLEYVATSSVHFADNNGIVGSYSGAIADVNGAPTALVAGYTDITTTFAGVEFDLGNGNGLRPYDCVVNCNNRPLIETYEYLKYLASKEYINSINGHPGNQYQAVGDVYLVYDTQTGAFTEGDLLTGSSSGATGIIVADHNTNPSGAMTLRDVRGIFQNGETITDETTGNANVNGTTDTIARVEAAPFGTLAGGKFFGARGVWLSNVLPADTNSYELIDSEGFRQVPPLSITLTVNGLAVNDQVAVFKATGDNNTIDKNMFTIDSTTPTGAGVTTVRVNETIPADTPSSGTLRVVHRSATGRVESEEKLTYSSFNNTNQPTYSTFTVGSFNSTLDTTDTAYVPYLDTTADTTFESVALIYVANRYITTRVRKSGILPFMTKGQITGANTTITAVRAVDAIA